MSSPAIPYRRMLTLKMKPAAIRLVERQSIRIIKMEPIMLPELRKGACEMVSALLVKYERLWK
jgi:hypothetical protein